MKKPMFILEMANNHNRDIEKGKQIINSFAPFARQYPHFQFVFKFQRRNLDRLIHLSHRNNYDHPYIKRFLQTQITTKQLQELIDHAKTNLFKVACTPFDEAAVEEISTMDLDYVKVGSCSMNDWPLLQKVSDMGLPVIASVGGATNDEIDKMVSFFEHRVNELSIMHCVGLYPCDKEFLSLDRIDTLVKQYGDKHRIGYSTHEPGSNILATSLAMAKGATIFEKHVDISSETRNAYSVLPSEYKQMLVNALDTHYMCNDSNWIHDLKRERAKLQGLKRAAYATHDLKPGSMITRDDVCFKMPCDSKDQITVFDFDKYTEYYTHHFIPQGRAVLHTEVDTFDRRDDIQDIHDSVDAVLKHSNVNYPKNAQMEISHHYGLRNFSRYGMCIITLINHEYCKKVLVCGSNQTNPEHYHKQKRETFFVVAGDAVINVDGMNNYLSVGEMITIEPGYKHMISGGINGAIIEELSTNHKGNDSFYTDDSITLNTSRKTTVYL